MEKILSNKNDYALSKWVSEIQQNSKEMFNTETVRIRILIHMDLQHLVIEVYADLFIKL